MVLVEGTATRAPDRAQPVTGMGEADVPGWSWLRYRLPPGPSRHGVALWRELQRRGALNLQRGEWAIPHDAIGPADLGAVHELLHRAGGTSEVVESVRDHQDRDALTDRLALLCDRLWDPFFNEHDSLVERFRQRSAEEVRLEPALDALRLRYLQTIRHDIVASPAGRRAGRRLEECYAQLDPSATLTLEDEAGRAALRAACPRPTVRDDVTCWNRGPGSVELLLVVEPVPSRRWERAFAAFESYAYVPSASRPALVHGAFACSSDPASMRTVVPRLRTRVRAFDLSLA